MLLLASEALRGTRSVCDVARELSLSLTHFDDPRAFSARMTGRSRRIVLLSEDHLSKDMIRRLEALNGRLPFALIVASDLASASRALESGLVDVLLDLPYLEWLGSNFDPFKLGDSVKRCRLRMLQFSREELETAFEKFEFVLRYQPKVERGPGTEWRTREVEALVRWLHPQRGLLGPSEFLPEIEAFGLMPGLTEFVLRKTASQVCKWREQDLGLDVCINLASSQLARTGLARDYAAFVREHGAECSNFTLEVVEQDLADPGDAPHLATLNRLREQGFRVCLDNFRVAARSLAMLERLPFDEIKIHASALSRAQDDEVARRVLAAVTGLAHKLGMSVSAEGVEDQRTFEFLRTIQCDKLQGLLISEAVLPHIVRKAYSASGSAAEEHFA